jgi:RsiW-degrading membrane proteinase PrsW (M82 family)
VDSRAVLLSSLLGVAYVLLLLFLDKYEREPLRKIAWLFAVSILATGLYGGLITRITGMDEELTLARACVRTPLLEEGLKYGIFLFVFLVWRKWIDEPFDLVVYLGIIALGFTVQENLGYYLSFTHGAFISGHVTGDFSCYDRALAGIALHRVLPGHLMMETAGAWVMARGIGARSFPLWFVLAYLASVAAHAIWNLTAAGGIFFFRVYSIALVLFCCWIVLRLRERSVYWRMQQHWQRATRGVLDEIEKQIGAIASIPAGLRPRMESIAARLRWILRELRVLPVRSGTDQAGVFRAFEAQSLSGLPALDEVGLADLDDRLGRLVETLKPYRNVSMHWTYWIALLAIFVTVGFCATVASMVIEAIAMFS